MRINEKRVYSLLGRKVNRQINCTVIQAREKKKLKTGTKKERKKTETNKTPNKPKQNKVHEKVKVKKSNFFPAFYECCVG